MIKDLLKRGLKFTIFSTGKVKDHPENKRTTAKEDILKRRKEREK
jgi:hypothetical protein